MINRYSFYIPKKKKIDIENIEIFFIDIFINGMLL